MIRPSSELKLALAKPPTAVYHFLVYHYTAFLRQHLELQIKDYTLRCYIPNSRMSLVELPANNMIFFYAFEKPITPII